MRISDWSSDVCSSDLAGAQGKTRGTAFTRTIMANRLALFDCDGTLVDSQHNICTAMDRAFEAVKLAPPPRHHTLAVVGLSLPQAMAVLLPDAEADFHKHSAEQYKLMYKAMRRQGVVDELLV